MRVGLMILPFALIAGPALGQTKPAPAEPAIPPAIPQVLSDPATADRLAGMMQALSKAFLNLPVGEVEAAAQGRAVTPADRNRTLREVGRKDNPNFERDLQATLAGSRATMQASMKALAAALPAMMKGLANAGREMEKAAENMPRPNYPKR
jgi:hypothetical protein